MATGLAFGWQVENANGTPVSGAKVYFFAPGTTTPRTTYTDQGMTVPAANPVIADSAGWFLTYISSELPYDVVIKSADDSITYQEREIASNISGAQPVDATLTAIAGLTVGAGDYIEATAADTFRARKLQVATYAALTAIPAASRFDDMVIYVTSRATDGDGGDGFWRFDAASSATANGGTILAPDAGTGRWVRQYKGVLKTEWFGVTADGVTDDTTALQAAVTAAGSGVLVAQAGTIVHTQITLATAGFTLRGQGKRLTIFKQKDNTNGRNFFASALANLSLEGFTVDNNSAGGNDGNGAHDCIRFETCTDASIVDVRVTNASGTFSGSPVGAGVSFFNGTRPKLLRVSGDNCFDGLSTFGTTYGSDAYCKFTDCERFGFVIGASSDYWVSSFLTSTGNSTLVSSGGNYACENSDNCQLHSAILNDAVLSFGGLVYQSDNFTATNIESNDNGLDGFGPYQSLQFTIHNLSSSGNAVRGLTIDTSSDGAVASGKIYLRDNGDVDLSVFRSADVTIYNPDCVTFRAHEAAVAESVAIAAGGSGYTDGAFVVAIAGGTIGPLGAATFTATVSGGAVTAVSALINTGEHWDLPANPVSVTGLTGGAGATFDVTWLGADEQRCDGLTVIGGGEGCTLELAADPLTGGTAASNTRLIGFKGTLLDTGNGLVAAVGCPEIELPFANASLQNSWVVDTRAIYYKDADGIVHIEGRVKSGTVSPDTIIFTLPAGFRPANTEYFSIIVSGGVGGVYVSADGTVRDLSGTFNATWSSLNGISFRAA